MRVIRDKRQMRDLVREAKGKGKRIGLVPTMGCLHEGHLSLVREVVRRGCLPVVTIFVNPIQFGPNEDFARYPRPFENDRRLCEQEGVAFLFAPSSDVMYDPQHSVYVEETRLSGGLCGASRPGHFRGVTTVVAKLFNICEPDMAIFGRKDAQQARMIEHMADCLDMAVEIVVAPIVRESDGLAMSSRNRYLSPEEREQALCLSLALREAGSAYQKGERDAQRLLALMERGIRARPLAQADYLAIVDYRSLTPVKEVGPMTLLALAVRVGQTRLIDNMLINEAGEPIL